MARVISKSGMGLLSPHAIAYQETKAALRKETGLGGVTIWIEGDEELRRELGLLREAHQRRIVRPAVNKALTPINKAAKRLCPVQYGNHQRPVQYGNLKRSIGKRVRSYSRANVVWGGVGSRTDPKYWRRDKRWPSGFAKPYKYHHFVERGTRHSAAKPHMRPAYEANKGLAQAILRASVREGLAKYWAGRARGRIAA